MKSKILNLLICVLTVTLLSDAISQPIALNGESAIIKILTDAHIPEYQFHVIHTYPHDTNSFTEGLFFEHGFMYESTGLYGKSLLRKIELDTAKTLKEYILPKNYFGEGMTIMGDKLYQLTWQEHTGFIYDKNTFQIKKNFTFQHEGWGLTTDGSELILSNGSAVLTWLEPINFKPVKTLAVTVSDKKLSSINELEYIDGMIYANVWPTSIIVLISPQTGKVQGWFNIKTLKPRSGSNDSVANGIAYNAQDKLIYITGKMWPNLYAIRIFPPT